MDIKEKCMALLSPLIGFFTKEEKATRGELSKLDIAEIFMALLPSAVFGCLIFGLRALLVLVLSVALSFGLDFLWDIIYKKEQKGINYITVIYGLITGLILSSSLNILLVIAVNIIAFALRKTVFKNKKMGITPPIIAARVVLALVFFKAFSVYAIPFLGSTNGLLPLKGMFMDAAYSYSAKYLFFGIHSGNIGETSVLLLGIGGIYLILRKIINPIIPISLIVTSTALSIIFGENITLSLLGSGIFFAAFFMTIHYSFTSSARYKKILYGAFCGVLTFLIRLILKSEGVYLAVLIADFVFLYLTKRNINRFIRFIKKPDFNKLLNSFKRLFSV